MSVYNLSLYTKDCLLPPSPPPPVTQTLEASSWTDVAPSMESTRGIAGNWRKNMYANKIAFLNQEICITWKHNLFNSSYKY